MKSNSEELTGRLAVTPSLGPGLQLRFPEPVESDFRQDYFNLTAIATRVAMIGGFVIWAAFGLLDYWLLPESRWMAALLRFGIGVPFYLLMIVMSFLVSPRRFLQHYAASAMLLVGFLIVLMIVFSETAEPAHRVYFAGIILVHMGGYVFLSLRFGIAALANLLILASYDVLYVVVGDGLATHDSRLQFLASNFFLVGANVLGLWSCYRLELFARRDFVLRRTVEAGQAEADRLLVNILPEEIAARLKAEPGTIAAAYPEASILFADIVDFTPTTAEMQPAELIDLLNDVFSFFDGLVEKHDVVKIKTIGDCYMAAAGVPSYRSDHAQALARMALEIKQYVAAHTFRGSRLAFRIGINSGPVVAGVIGRMKFSYDLWGDTVSLASRMESQGEKGCIQISPATYRLIRDSFVCESRGRVQIKGVGPVDTWYLTCEKEKSRLGS